MSEEFNEERFNQFESIPVQASGKGIRENKDPLNGFSWTSAPEWLKNMVRTSSNPIQMKAFMEQNIRELQMTPREQIRYLRPDPVPESYRRNWEDLMLAEPKLKLTLNVNPTGLTIEQILAQDRHFHRTYVMNNVFAQILARYGCTFFMQDGKKWEIKHHEITNYGWPKFSQDFRNLGSVEIGPEGKKSIGYGWGAMYEIPFTAIEMAAGGTYDPEYWAVFFLSQNMGIFGDERGWLGGMGRNTQSQGGAPYLYGLYNWKDYDGNFRGGITSPGATYGFSSGVTDFDDNYADILKSWYDNSVFGGGPESNVYVTQAGIAAETSIHDSAVGDLKSAYQVIQDKWFRTGDFDSWYVTNNLTSVATASITSAKQRWLALKMTPNYIRRTVVYPLQRKTLSDKFKTYKDDVAFAYITGDILQVYDRRAICGPSSGTTTHGKCQRTGWRENGLFMDRNTGIYMAGYRAPIREQA